MIRVLLIEDDPLIARIIRYYLNQEDYCSVEHAKTAGEAFSMARDSFDVILLDIILPDANGIDLCGRLRHWHHCPIIFISCLDDTDTIVMALKAGGDDYIVKPFDNKILSAKIEANIRRAKMDSENPPPNTLVSKGFTLDAARHCVIFQDGRTTQLSQIEFRILRFFMQHPNTYFGSEELYQKIWGKDSNNDVRTVLVHIHNLRSKLEADQSNPEYLCSEWGKGYIFRPKGQ